MTYRDKVKDKTNRDYAILIATRNMYEENLRVFFNRKGNWKMYGSILSA